MTIREWLEDLRFAGMKLGLERAQALLERLGNPQLEFPSIHVAGTNGKGSLCAQLSANATASGFSVGLFTTPHLVMVEERIRIDGRPISSADFDRHVEAVHEAASEGEVLEPTFYE
ncbi:MAG: bifunctional folylpolyglutamate synthase/dihydrofolate synthase, partial [Candidatus Poseidoniia archaeon]